MENCLENVWNFLHIHVMCNLTLALWENMSFARARIAILSAILLSILGVLFEYPLAQNEGWIGNNFKLLLFDDYPSIRVHVGVQFF